MRSDKDPQNQQSAAGHSRRSLLAVLAAGCATAAAAVPGRDLSAKKKKKKKPATWSHITTFGSGSGPDDTRFTNPSGVALSPDTLTAWITDSENQRISVWTRPNAASIEWTHATNFGSGPGEDQTSLNYPIGLAVAPDTLTVLVADTANSRISVWTRPDSSSTAWNHAINFGSPGYGEAEFFFPREVVISADGRTAWVADTNNARISVWDRSTSSSTDWTHSITFGSKGSGIENLNDPWGVAVSADSRTVWVADSYNSRISVWTRPNITSTEWSHSAVFGRFGQGDTNFNTPYGIAVSADACTAFVADTYNSRITVWTRPNAVSTDWRYSTKFGSEGAEDINFYWPFGIAVSPDGGTAWVADVSNNRVSIWTNR